MYQAARPGDVTLITSPVGLPGRALKNPFVEKILSHTVPRPSGCDFCLKHCSLEYCIIQALINSQRGDVDHGVVFCGENVVNIKDRAIKPARQIIEELVAEAAAAR
jgi:NAD(P)H-dependent flavin oxidoreductase YrpB (nitropropane dioxygenase family)